MISWKHILAFAVLAAPLAWCEAETKKRDAEQAVVCLQVGGVWLKSWGGYCDRGMP